MKVGLISDTHANVVALRAVLDDASVEEWIHAGDIVGYGPWPAETIEVFRTRGITSIQGNHDRAALDDFHEGFHGIPRTIIEWTQERLTADELAYLDALPVELDYDSRGVRVVHGAPDAPNAYTYPEDIRASLLRTERTLVLGHTHKQFLREFEDRQIVNPGSVGQPRDGDPRAAYAVLDIETTQIQLRRVEYPRETVQAKLRDHEFPEPLVEAYETGRIVPAERAERT